MDLQKNKKLFGRIQRGVAENDSAKLTDLYDTLSNYDGDARLLGAFLDQFDSDDPWEAANNAELVQAIFRTKKELKLNGEILGISASGHKLTNQIFVMRNKQNPLATYISGATTLTKIMQSFGTEQQKDALTPEGRQRIIDERDQRATNNIVETLEEVLDNPDRITDVQSRNDRLQVHKILGLDEELRKRILQIDKLIYGNTSFMDQTSKSFLLAADKGGMLLGRLGRKLSMLPQSIRDIYTTYTSPQIQLSESKEKQLLGVLMAYAAIDTPISRKAAIGGYQKDFDFLLQLPDNHQLITKFGRPDLSGIRAILAQPEITLVEATRVFDAYPVDKVRFEVNKSYNLPDFNLDLFADLFMEDSVWLPDSCGASVPMKRLEHHPFYKTLTRNDFQSARDLLRVRTLAKSKEGMYKALPMQDFKQVVDEVTIAKRKIDYMNAKLAGISDEDITQSIHPPLLRGTGYDLAENFKLHYGIDLNEFIQRAESICYEDSWRRNSNPIRDVSEIGLYEIKRIVRLEKLVGKVAKYVPLTDIRLEVAAAQVVLTHPLQRDTWKRYEARAAKYIEPKRAEWIRNLAGPVAAAIVDGETKTDDLAGLIERKRAYEGAGFFTGNLDDNLTVTRQANWIVPVKEMHDVAIYDVEQLINQLDEFDSNYTKATNLPENWKKKGRQISGISIHHSYGVNQIYDQAYVDNDLVVAVEEAYQIKKESVVIENSVISNGSELLNPAELWDTYHVTVTGTSQNDAGRFKPAFFEFKWDKYDFKWNSSGQSLEQVANISQRIKDYNNQNGSNLKLNVAGRQSW